MSDGVPENGIRATIEANQRLALLWHEESRQDARDVSSQLTAIRSDISELKANGCGVGKRNKERIEQLERKPERLPAIIAALASIAAAAAAWIARIHI